MKTIITIQHTQSEQHVNGMIGSWRDWDLTARGEEQARRIGARLAEELGGKPLAIYASDLLRARRTAQLVGERFAVTPTLTDALREFNLGEAIGNSKDWARASARCPLWAQTIDWAVSIDERPFTGAETKREVWSRLLPFLHQLLASKDERIIVVSHDGTLSLFYAMWLGFEPEMLENFGLFGKSGGVSFLVEDADKRRTIARLNDLSYVR